MGGGGDCGVSRGVSKTRAMSQVVSPVDVRTYCVSRDVSVGVSSGVSSCAALAGIYLHALSTYTES